MTGNFHEKVAVIEKILQKFIPTYYSHYDKTVEIFCNRILLQFQKFTKKFPRK